MPALLSWVLMLGGIATTVAAAVLAAEVEFEVALALVGLLATLGGAVGLVLTRVAGNAPSAMRPPGATGRVNAPTAMGPVGAPTRSRTRRGRGRGRTAAAMPGSTSPVVAAIPTGPTRAGMSRTPVVLVAFFVGAAWNLTNSATASGPLDYVAAALLVAAPIAAVMAVATRIMVGKAWAPAVTVAVAGISFFLGSVVADMFLRTLG